MMMLEDIGNPIGAVENADGNDGGRLGGNPVAALGGRLGGTVD
jgi:hypothetical protein